MTPDAVQAVRGAAPLQLTCKSKLFNFHLVNPTQRIYPCVWQEAELAVVILTHQAASGGAIC